MSTKENEQPKIEDGLKAPAGEATQPGPFSESQAETPQQTEIPGAEKPKSEGPGPVRTVVMEADQAPKLPAKPKQPRTADEIEHDFRFAKFTGKIQKVVQDWKNDKDFQMAVVIDSTEEDNLTAGLKRFNGSDEIAFRLLPKQPELSERFPEEFGDKVSQFGVAMVERLEKKAAQGFKGWEQMSPRQILDRIHDIAQDLPYINEAYVPDPNHPYDLEDPQKLIDLADYVFFLWFRTIVARSKNGG